MAAHQSASRILPKLAVAATATGGTILTCHHFENQRRILEAKSSDDYGCKSSTVTGALSSLQTSGVAIVDNLRLTPTTINEVMNMPAANTIPTQLKPPKRPQQQRRRGPPGANMVPQDEPWRLSAYGRYHRLENHLGEEDIRVLEQIEQRILPLVQGFFEQEGKGQGSVGGGDEGLESTATRTTSTTTTNNTIMDGIYRSELQLMTAVPGSGNQSWHKDNRARGLSIIVPLVDFTPDNGGTQLLLGSHDTNWPLFANGGARVIHAPAGSIVAYDSRTIHRGLGNETNEGRPALIFCYDRVESPPPGCGTLGSVGTSYQGRLIDILTGARNAVSSENT
mmetsp:Transcript_14395/g.20416  ORF Transcript_14395/g.20416 Transcript_14395/m.20416 type:complete len:337 (-) Transcript_14395:141-1151(-)